MIIVRCLLVDSCSSCSLCEIERAHQVVFGDHYEVKVTALIHKFARILGEDSLYLMIDLMREHMKEHYIMGGRSETFTLSHASTGLRFWINCAESKKHYTPQSSIFTETLFPAPALSSCQSRILWRGGDTSGRRACES